MDWSYVIVFYGGIALVAGAGAYLGSYLKTKGKNLATREDMEGIVTEVHAVTRTAESIKSEISGNLWSRQKEWELKRDILFEIAQKAGKAITALAALHAVHMTEQTNRARGLPERMDKALEVGDRWLLIAAELQGMLVVTRATCGNELIQATGDFGLFVGERAQEIMDGNPEMFLQRTKDLAALSHALSMAIRTELELRVKSQSN